MIFVTVGTHEQPFNRLIEYIDRLKEEGIIEEDVIIQTGYSTYNPKYCKWKKLFPYSSMMELVKDARIVITHGGPSSFIMPLQVGKVPIVVPRKKEYNEHINNHQVSFAKEVEERMQMIITIDDIAELKNAILNYNEIIKEKISQTTTNNKIFNDKLEKIVIEMFEKGR